MQESSNQDDVRMLLICLLVLLGFALVFPKYKDLLDECIDRKYAEMKKPEKEISEESPDKPED